MFFFAVWAGGVFFFLLFGRGTGVHSLTRLPGSSLSDPTTKETEQQKKKRVPRGSARSYKKKMFSIAKIKSHAGWGSGFRAYVGSLGLSPCVSEVVQFQCKA